MEENKKIRKIRIKPSSQKSQEKPGGNTKTPGPKNQLYRWFFTLPYEECNASQLSQVLKSLKCKEFYFQGEIGKEDGFKHWQACFRLERKEYFGTVKNLLGFNKAHIEGVQDWPKSKQYCQKEDTRFEGPYNIESIFVKTPVLDKQWQLDAVKECLEEPDYRKIRWFYDEKGGAGKTNLCLHMYDKMGASVFNNGKFSDIAYALPDNPKIVIFDLPRSLEERVNYGAIEAVKNGFIFSGKYESKAKRFDKPHVIVMANFEPDYSALSADRWEIIKLSEFEFKKEED